MKFLKLVFAFLLLACSARYAVGNNPVCIVEEAMDEIIVVQAFKQNTEKPVLRDYYRIYFVRNGQVMAVRSFSRNGVDDFKGPPLWSSTIRTENKKQVPYLLMMFDEYGYVDGKWERITRAIYAKSISFITTQTDPSDMNNDGGQWWNQNRNMRDLKQP